MEKVVAYCNTNMCVKIKPEELENVAALKVAMKNLAAKYSCNAIAIQCWNALQGEIGIMPCAANSLLNEEGIPVVCETDIHGAITALMVEAAGRNDKEASLLTGRYVTRTTRTASCCSTADRGRSLLHRKNRRSVILWHSVIREL